MRRRTLDTNLIVNGDFSNTPVFTQVTTSANTWIDGNSGSPAIRGYGWAIPAGAVGPSAAASFDATVKHSGTASLKLSTLNSAGSIIVTNYKTLNNISLIPADPSTAHTFSVWVKTSNVASNGAGVTIREYSSATGLLATQTTSRLSGTNDWTQLVKTFTTTANTAFFSILMQNNVAGNVSDVWYDDLVLTPANSPSRKTID